MSKLQKPPIGAISKSPEQVEKEAIQEELERNGIVLPIEPKTDSVKALKPVPDEFKGSARDRKATSYRISESTRGLIDLLHRLEKGNKDISSPRKKEDIVEDALQAYLKSALKKYGYDTTL